MAKEAWAHEAENDETDDVIRGVVCFGSVDKAESGVLGPLVRRRLLKIREFTIETGLRQFLKLLTEANHVYLVLDPEPESYESWRIDELLYRLE